jgi:hypothetical protein
MNQQSIETNEQLTLNDSSAQNDGTRSEVTSGMLPTPDTEMFCVILFI